MITTTCWILWMPCRDVTAVGVVAVFASAASARETVSAVINIPRTTMRGALRGGTQSGTPRQLARFGRSTRSPHASVRSIYRPDPKAWLSKVGLPAGPCPTRVERRSHYPRVAGSNPAGGTHFYRHCAGLSAPARDPLHRRRTASRPLVRRLPARRAARRPWRGGADRALSAEHLCH